MYMRKLNGESSYSGNVGKRAFKIEEKVKLSGNFQEYGLPKVKLHARKCQEMT